jgi:hypothetical protein
MNAIGQEIILVHGPKYTYMYVPQTSPITSQNDGATTGVAARCCKRTVKRGTLCIPRMSHGTPTYPVCTLCHVSLWRTAVCKASWAWRDTPVTKCPRDNDILRARTSASRPCRVDSISSPSVRAQYRHSLEPSKTDCALQSAR